MYKSAEGGRLRVLAAFLVFAFALALYGGTAAAQTRPDLPRAEALMREGKPAEAYALLAPFEDRMAGNVEFDYLLGISALDSGKPDRATLAFERVLAVNPNFAGARLDLARAYFALGDHQRAKAEFQTVLGQNPPEGARQTVTRYLAAIEDAEKAKLRKATAYVEATLGHDSNVNNSTSNAIVTVPALGNLAFTLNPTNVKTDDSFGVIAAGAEFGQQITPNLGLFAGADWRYRAHEEQDIFDADNRDLRFGFTVGPAENQFRATASSGRHRLDRRLNRTIEGLALDWRMQVDLTTQLSPFVSFNKIRFTDPALAVNSFDAYTLGTAALKVVADGRAALFGAIFSGKDQDVQGRADGARKFAGVRGGGQYSLRGDLDLYGFLSAQTAHYDRRNVAFLTHRKEDLVELTTGLAWRFARGWTLRPAVSTSRNASNIPLFSYERTEASLTLRRDFAF